MIFIPWIVFIIGMAWIFWQGSKAKTEYKRRKSEEDEQKKQAAREDKLVESLKVPSTAQEKQILGIDAAMMGGALKTNRQDMN
jgi:hypothetical protein